MAEASRPVRAVCGLSLEAAGGPAVRLALAESRTLVNLRGRLQDQHFASAVQEVLGVALPEAPNRWSGDEQRAILWLGPDEWLIISPEGEAPDIESRLREAAGDDPWLSVVDLSHNYTGFTLTGRAAHEVLAKGCPLDLHPRRFHRGHCAQTLLARIHVLLRSAGIEHRIEIWVRNSFARYAAAWLIDAMAEYGP